MQENHRSFQDRRQHSSEELTAAIATAFQQVLVSNPVVQISQEQHAEHHEFISDHRQFLETWVEEVKQRRIRNEKLKTQILGWGAVTFLGTIGTGCYNAAIYLKEHFK